MRRVRGNYGRAAVDVGEKWENRDRGKYKRKNFEKG